MEKGNVSPSEKDRVVGWFLGVSGDEPFLRRPARRGTAAEPKNTIGVQTRHLHRHPDTGEIIAEVVTVTIPQKEYDRLAPTGFFAGWSFASLGKFARGTLLRSYQPAQHLPS